MMVLVDEKVFEAVSKKGGSFAQPSSTVEKVLCPFLGVECSPSCRAFFVDDEGVSHCLRLWRAEKEVAREVSFGEEEADDE